MPFTSYTSVSDVAHAHRIHVNMPAFLHRRRSNLATNFGPNWRLRCAKCPLNRQTPLSAKC